MTYDSYIQDLAEDKQIMKMEKRLNTRRPRAPMNITNKNITKFNVSSMNFEEIEEKKNELMEKRDGIWRCLDLVTVSQTGVVPPGLIGHIW